MGFGSVTLFVPHVLSNMFAQQESTGQANRIQVSRATADLLIASGKQHWVHRRHDSVHVKGKGILETFFITPPSRDAASSIELPDSPGVASVFAANEQQQERLVSWMVELFKRRVATIIAHQDPRKIGKCCPSDLIYRVPEGKTSLDEVAEVIKLPTFDAAAAERAENRGEVELSDTLVTQLKEIVTAIAASYQNNPFHVSDVFGLRAGPIPCNPISPGPISYD